MSCPQVASKMDVELEYSRAKLRQDLKRGADVTQLRKRVSWLERRIERVLGRKVSGRADCGTVSAVVHW